MVLYRPHRGRLWGSLEETRKFNNIEDMFKWTVKDTNSCWNDEILSYEDLSIDEEGYFDNRTDWGRTHYVLTKRYGNKKYKTPQCIGMCSPSGYTKQQ